MKRRTFINTLTLSPFVTKAAISTSPAQTLTHTNDREFFYKPLDGWAADFIPLYAKGKFQLFYLLDFRHTEKHGEGTPWYRITTNDFVRFEEHGEAIPRGSKDDQDLFIFTGSAIEADNRFHIFYTGHNHHLADKGKPMQAVMHAVSDDLQHWKKIQEHTFFAPTNKYEQHDWRDPFVFWNDESKEYNMLLAARLKEGVKRRRGLTVLCTSKDLIKWEVQEPFYSPGLYFTHECPDLFRMGDWWYLIFSEFTDKVKTKYVMSKNIRGPWQIPANDEFDSHAFYAAKSASEGHKRFLFGWNPTRDQNNDNGGWQWGGNLVVHEIHQDTNGELLVKAPDSVKNAFSKTTKLEWKSVAGNNSFDPNGNITLNADGTFACILAGEMPELCRISAKCRIVAQTREAGIAFRSSDDLEQGYYVRLEPYNSRVVFDRWPRVRSEVPHMAEFERPIEIKPGNDVTFDLFIDGNKGVLYLNDRVAMNFRAYDFKKGKWGLFATDGSVVFKDVALYIP